MDSPLEAEEAGVTIADRKNLRSHQLKSKNWDFVKRVESREIHVWVLLQNLHSGNAKTFSKFHNRLLSKHFNDRINLEKFLLCSLLSSQIFFFASSTSFSRSSLSMTEAMLVFTF